MHVNDYFRAMFGDHPTIDELDPITECDPMPISSPCGYECKRAIDTGREMFIHITNAHGDWPKGEDMRDTIIRYTHNICQVYCNG